MACFSRSSAVICVRKAWNAHVVLPPVLPPEFAHREARRMMLARPPVPNGAVVELADPVRDYKAI
jgi:hypothetical protein